MSEEQHEGLELHIHSKRLQHSGEQLGTEHPSQRALPQARVPWLWASCHHGDVARGCWLFPATLVLHAVERVGGTMAPPGLPAWG